MRRRVRSWAAVLALLVLGAAAWHIFTPRPPRETQPQPAAPHAERPEPPVLPRRPETITRLPVSAEGATLNAPDRSARDDLATLDLLLSEYRKHWNGNPVGENVEIAAALLGNNPKSLAYLPASGRFLDSSGRLIDRWGTPYFFHALSGDVMEIRSAGPDHELHTADDIIHRPGD